MSNFTKRFITSVVYASVVFFCTLYSKESFIVFASLVSILCLYEYGKMTQITKVQLVLMNLLNFGILFSTELWMFVSMVFIPIVLELFCNRKNPIENLGKLFFGLIYISLPFKLIIDMNFQKLFILYIFIIIWTSDSFAYLIGRKIGRTKLIPHISPKKTVEGLLASILFGNMMAYVLWSYSSMYSLGTFILLANIICIAGILGDLVESMVKRQYNVKDSGNILPGHGGILDRFDSFIFSCPFIYIFTEIIE